MSDLLGFVSIALLFLFTMWLALRWSDIKNILFVALIIRILILLFGHYFVTLPDSTADAETFQDILNGDLDATSAFMSGRLSVDGDMGTAMQLAGLLG